MEEFIKVGKAAQILGFSGPQYLVFLSKEGRIPAHQIGVLPNGKKRWGYRKRELESYLKDRAEALREKKVKSIVGKIESLESQLNLLKENK
jgi:hypothetical protein